MLLDEPTVCQLLRMEDLIPLMERALASFSLGDVVQPVRSVLPVDEHAAFLGLMPAYTGRALGVKLVTVYPRNTDFPSHQAVIQLFHPQTGEPLVTMDGRLITEMRTAAVSAVATRYLARPESRVLAILGAGVQAGSHLEALRLVRAFPEVRVWSPHRAAEFARQHGVHAMASAEEAVRGADVIVTVTSSQTPVLHGAWLSPGTHINAVGACRPDWRELDDDVLRCARLYVDSRAAAAAESGDVIAAGIVAAPNRGSSEARGPADMGVVGEIGEVVTGDVPGRQSEDEITLFKSLGLAVEDVATADLVYRRLTDYTA